MIRDFVRISALLLVSTLAAFSFGQSKPSPKAGVSQAPQQYLITVIRLNPGMAPEWQDLMKSEVIPAMQKGGADQWHLWRTATFGESGEIIMARPLNNMGQLDTESPIVKALGQQGATALMAKAQRLAANSRTFMISARPDLSIPPASGYTPMLAVMATTSVFPGRIEEFEKGYKQMLAVIGKTNAKGTLVFRVGLGGDPNEFVSLVLFDTFADIGQFPEAYRKAAAESKLAPQPAGIAAHNEYRTIRYVPEMSLQSAVQKAAK
jgi:hypothetical protein